MDAIRAHYRFISAEPERDAEALAGELSTGTFTALPGESAAIRIRHSAVVESLALLDQRPRGAHRVDLQIRVPAENIGASLPTLMATLAGNVFELRSIRSLTLVDFELPQDVLRELPGPAFGVDGTRARCGTTGLPLIGTIVKPSIGLTPEQTADIARLVSDAGIDFIKDDELLANPAYSPRQTRIELIGASSRDHTRANGPSDLLRAQHHRRDRADAPCAGARRETSDRRRDGLRERRRRQRHPRAAPSRPDPIARPSGRLGPARGAGLARRSAPARTRAYGVSPASTSSTSAESTRSSLRQTTRSKTRFAPASRAVSIDRRCRSSQLDNGADSSHAPARPPRAPTSCTSRAEPSMGIRWGPPLVSARCMMLRGAP